MLGNIAPLKLFASVAVIGVASFTVACTQSSSDNAANQRPPLPSSGFSANPASPNCYPDINHCASYSTGGVSQDNPAQPQQQQR